MFYVTLIKALEGSKVQVLLNAHVWHESLQLILRGWAGSDLRESK